MVVGPQHHQGTTVPTHHSPEQPNSPQNGKLSKAGVFATVAMLVSGTCTAVLTKAAYELEAVGRYGVMEHFEKPWCLTAVMFLGMSLCLPVAYWDKIKHRHAQDPKTVQQPLFGKIFDAAEMREVAMLSLPAALDLVATVLMYIGLLSVTASVYQMLRGAMLIFAALFGTLFLKRQLNNLHYGGIVGTLVGISIVGAASLLSGEGSATRDVPQAEMIMGLVACIAGQCMQAAQVTVEDHLLSQHNVSPLKVVGYEGVLGGLATVLLVMPLVAIVPESAVFKGLHEDTIDTLIMIQNSPTIAAVLVADLIAFCGLNLSGMVVIQELGAVYKTVLETARTLFVWLVGLGLYYSALGGGVVGESWHDHSNVQLAGFAVLVMGTVLFGAGNRQRVKEKEEQIAALEEALLVGHLDTATSSSDFSSDDESGPTPPASRNTSNGKRSDALVGTAAAMQLPVMHGATNGVSVNGVQHGGPHMDDRVPVGGPAGALPHEGPVVVVAEQTANSDANSEARVEQDVLAWTEGVTDGRVAPAYVAVSRSAISAVLAGPLAGPHAGALGPTSRGGGVSGVVRQQRVASRPAQQKAFAAAGVGSFRVPVQRRQRVQHGVSRRLASATSVMRVL